MAGSGWNAGAGFANSFLGTLQGLTSLENAQMKNEEMRREMKDKEAMANYLAEASQQKNYTGGQAIGQAINQATSVYGNDTDTANTVKGIIANQTPEQQQATLRAYGGAAGAQTPASTPGALDLSKVGVYKNAKGEAMASTEGGALSAADQYKYALKKAQESGNTYAIEKLLPLKNAMRESENQDKFDAEMNGLNQTLARIHGTAESGGLKGLYEAGKQEGLKLNFVEGKNGVGSRIQVLGPKGDVLETVSDIGTATQKLSDAAMSQFMNKSISLLGSPDKVIAAMQGNKKIGIEERGVAVKEAIAPSEIAKNMGAANYYNAGGRAASGSDAKNYRQSVVEITDDKGNKQKVPVISHVVTGKDGVPQIQAYTLDGKPVTDSKIINQLVGAGDSGDTALGADLAAMRKRFEANGYSSYAEYLADVEQAIKNSSLNKALPPAGSSLNPNAGKPAAASNKAIPVASEGEKRIDALAEKQGWKSYGPGSEMYHRIGPDGEVQAIKAADLAKQLGVIY